MATGKLRRNTRQRQVILEELQKLTSHPTAAELYRVVCKRLPKISLGTVYRNLEFLVQNDIIQKLDISGSEARFDCNAGQHPHVRCIHCDRADDLHDIPADLIGHRLKESNGWKILGYRLEFIGICPECKGTHKKGMYPYN